MKIKVKVFEGFSVQGVVASIEKVTTRRVLGYTWSDDGTLEIEVEDPAPPSFDVEEVEDPAPPSGCGCGF